MSHSSHPVRSAFLACLLSCVWPLAGLAQTASEVADKREDLKELRGRIENLRKELSASEESRADAADQLKQVERQISDGERKLLGLKRDQPRSGENGGQTRVLGDGEAATQCLMGQPGYRHRAQIVTLQLQQTHGTAAQCLMDGGDEPILTHSPGELSGQIGQ